MVGSLRHNGTLPEQLIGQSDGRLEHRWKHELEENENPKHMRNVFIAPEPSYGEHKKSQDGDRNRVVQSDLKQAIHP
ncbi:unnamed protein product, partial [marine sediment metagenome]